ncbi:reverse transcriptase [Beauveria brongniartii RCEF 3172]|uniref:Reverse transcriptase n=1 Tax=Beauveria brongniartii RCEF 3172 TaxID=1081107 RepID=A0A166W0S1_9HYPO|nr:reverse transcriptase [Beauveria brongniartii RCEF 3172]
MAIDQSFTPATGARGRRRFPDGFHHDAQNELMRGTTPVTTRPFPSSSSPVRRSTSAARNGRGQRRHIGKVVNPNANYYGILADEEDEIVDAFDAIDLESETRKIIAKEKERMTTRADVLRTFAESIAACARKFDHGYAHTVANDFTKSLLRHWNQFLHSGEIVGSSGELSQPKSQTTRKPAAGPPTDDQASRQKTVSFADVTKAAAQQTPGDVRIAPTRRQPVASRNYTNRRILLRLKEGSSFFEKNSFQIRLALKEKLALDTRDIQDIKPTNTGWALSARNEEIQKRIIESQGVWGPSVDLDTAEKHVVWHTYLIKDFPSELRSYDDSILDFEQTIGEEIIAQTGQTPVQWRRSSRPGSDPTKTTLIISFDRPVRGNFRLLGLGAYSFRLTKPKRLVQCQNCWLFHPPVRCTATKTCRTCGATDRDHDVERCQATPRCANCYGPHHADYEQCYARPKKVADTFHKLSKSQKIHARKLGADDYRRQNMESMTQSLNNPPAQNNNATTTGNTDIVDIEMADTAEDGITIAQQEDYLPAVGGDEDMIDTEQEQLWNNEGAIEEEEDVEIGVEELPDDQEPANEGENATEDVDEGEGTEEEGEDETDDNEDEDKDEDDNHIADERGDTRQSHQHEEQATSNSKKVPLLATSRRTGASVTKGLRRDIIPKRNPITLKKRYISTHMAQQIIPSGTTNPSSDPPTGDVILARTSPRHSPPSSPPQEARRRDQSPPKRRMTTRIFQANVDKGKEAHSAALQLAFLEGYSVVILQEPNTSYNKQKQLCRTQYHPGFLCFSPVDSWSTNDTRPRVMTYVKIDSKIQAEQISPTNTETFCGPEVKDTLKALEEWNPPENCVVAGDMNASHTSWQSDRPASQDGNRIHEWTERHDLHLLNEPDEKTTMARRKTRSSTIDLAFSNIPEASATVEVHLTTGSLHYTIGIEIPYREPARTVHGKIRVTTPDEIKAFGDHVGKAVKSLPTDVDSQAEIENMARQLQEILQNSAKACGRVSRGHRARSCPWWNQECKDAHDDLRITRRIYENQRGEEVQRARVRFCRVLRRARQKFWRKTINEVTTPGDVFKLTRWMKPKQRLQPPPIQVGDTTYSTDMEKAMALRKEKLERRDASDDITDAWQLAVSPARDIPFASTIPTKEIEKAVLHTGNTTPGSDGITTKMLQAAWSHIAQPLTTLYNACLRLGHHPSVFKVAEVVMIPKLNKRNLSDVSTWRPISLLSCLSKGLERVIARRMAYAAIKYGILHPNQAGALPKRSAVDIVVSLIYDIEKALAAGKVATLVTEDVMGAFDAILRNRMILRLRQQGWPDFLIRWIASFLLDRLASVRFQDTTTPSARLRCGLPQGSPISPILYVLITAAIYFLPGAAQRYGYADDTAMLFIGDSLEDTARQANEAIAAMESWGRGEAIHFDPKKTEVMHFSRRRADHSQSPIIHHGDKEIRAPTSMQWLGIWLDKKLTFNQHIVRWTQKARGVINHLRVMNNTVRGMSATAARRAVWSVAMPILFHGLDAWLPGLDTGGSRLKRNHISKTNLAKIQRVLNLACKMILPMWKTTPLEFLWREAGIPPANVLLRHIQERVAVRYATLDKAHPISKRLRQSQREIELNEKPLIAKRMALRHSRLLRTAYRTAKVERPRLIPQRFSNHIQVEGPRERHIKEKAVADFEQWLAGRPAGYVVFSDGSKTDTDTAGYGFAVFHHGQLLDWGSGQLGRREVFDAEIHGALAGLKAAMQQNSRLEPITACFREFQKVGDRHPYLISVKWSPGHTGIFGNELADQLAKHGATLPTKEHVPSVSYRKRQTKKQIATDYHAWWASVERTEYQKLGLDAELKKLPELSLPRRVLGYLLTARSQHGDFAEYHERFHPGQATLDCPCGRQKSPTHLFYCRKIPGDLRVRLAPDPETAIGKFLGRSYKVYVRIADFYYSKINKRT